MVSTLKTISQIGSSSQLLGKIKNVPNHQPDDHLRYRVTIMIRLVVLVFMQSVYVVKQIFDTGCLIVTAFVIALCTLVY